MSIIILPHSYFGLFVKFSMIIIDTKIKLVTMKQNSRSVTFEISETSSVGF
jgi:hypothetical protein